MVFESSNPKDWGWQEWSIIAGGILILILLISAIAYAISSSARAKKQQRMRDEAEARFQQTRQRTIGTPITNIALSDYPRQSDTTYGSASNSPPSSPSSPSSDLETPLMPLPSSEYQKIPANFQRPIYEVPRPPASSLPVSPESQYGSIPGKYNPENPYGVLPERSPYGSMPNNPYGMIPEGMQ